MKTLSKLQQLSFIIRREFLAISTSYAVLLVLMGGIFVYGLLYNYMYAPNIVTDVPVAVVDNSHSELSRDFIRWLDATPQAEIYSQAMDYHEAKEWMKEGKVQGILYLPHDFEKRVFRGDEAVFSLYATTDAFLYFEALQGASSRVMLAINDKYRSDEAVFLPPQGLLAVAMAKPIHVEGTALYNYTEGYGSYLIPAVMMIIIFQTLLMVIGMVTGEEHSNRGIRAYTPFGYGWGVAIRIVAGKTSVYCALYAIFAFFLLGLLPHFFSIPNIGNGLYIVLLLIPYLMATSFGVGSFQVFYGFRSSPTHDRLLLCRINISFRGFLSDGTNALVLESCTLHSSGCTRHTCFCEIEFYGSQYGGYQTRIYNPLDTSTYLFYNKYMGLQEETGIRSN